MSNALNLGKIVLPGDNYPSIHGFSIPVTSGLEGAYLFGDGLGQVARNYAPGKAQASMVGAPVAYSGYCNFGADGYIDTGIAETADMTLITVCRDSTGSLSDPVPGYIGNNSSITGGGVAIFGGATENQLRGSNVKINTAVTPAAPGVEFLQVAGNPFAFTGQVLRARNAAPSSFENASTGAKLFSTGSGVRVVEKTYPILIGRIPSNTFKGLNDQVAALVYSRALSDAELDQVMAWLRSYCVSKGVSI